MKQHDEGQTGQHNALTLGDWCTTLAICCSTRAYTCSTSQQIFLCFYIYS